MALVFRYGTMNSGKSLQLLSLAYNFEMEGIPFIILKSEIDDRDGEKTIHSRAIPGDRECISVSKNDNIVDIVEDVLANNAIEYVLVDEAQFLSTEQIEQLAYIADTYGAEIYCYGLKTDFRTRLFPASQRLFEIADKFEEIESYSHFGYTEKTMFNARIDENGNIVRRGEQIEVGGNDRYRAMSRKEYFIKTNQYKKYANGESQ